MTISRRNRLNALVTPALAITVSFTIMAAVSQAQTPQAVCAKLLPADKLVAAAGAGLKNIDAEASDGYTACSWSRTDTGAGNVMREVMVVVKHHHKPSMATGADAGNLDEWLKVAVDESAGDKKDTRQAVAELAQPGKRAGIATRGAKLIVAVELGGGGMKRVETSYLTRTQAISLIQAVTAK